jgi:hypothetical protein
MHINKRLFIELTQGAKINPARASVIIEHVERERHRREVNRIKMYDGIVVLFKDDGTIEVQFIDPLDALKLNHLRFEAYYATSALIIWEVMLRDREGD